jgi:glycosyltransferase A (GT-A) superfamily protein (DUF2064 family)
VGFGPRRPHQPFAKVRWSSPHALSDTVANFRRHRVALLPPKRDVDSAEDLYVTSQRPRTFRAA